MAIIYNELNVAQGLGERNKVFEMTAGQAITYGMVCELSAGKLVKGFSGTGMAYVAVNSYTNEDATVNGVTYITVIPVTSGCEVEIPAALWTAAPSQNNEVEAATAGDVGKWVAGTGASTYIGTVTEATGPEGGVLVLLEKTVRAS